MRFRVEDGVVHAPQLGAVHGGLPDVFLLIVGSQVGLPDIVNPVAGIEAGLGEVKADKVDQQTLSNSDHVLSRDKGERTDARDQLGKGSSLGFLLAVIFAQLALDGLPEVEKTKSDCHCPALCVEDPEETLVGTHLHIKHYFFRSCCTNCLLNDIIEFLVGDEGSVGHVDPGAGDALATGS